MYGVFFVERIWTNLLFLCLFIVCETVQDLISDLCVCQDGVYGGAVPADRAGADYRSNNTGCATSLDPGTNKGDRTHIVSTSLLFTFFTFLCYLHTYMLI